MSLGQRFNGYRCESEMSPFNGKVTWSYAYSPFNNKIIINSFEIKPRKKKQKKHNNHLNFTLKIKIIVSEKLNNMILFFPLLRSLTVQYNIVLSKIKTQYNTKQLSTELYNTI